MKKQLLILLVLVMSSLASINTASGINQTNVTCFGNCDGSIDFNPGGVGIGYYTLLLNGNPFTFTSMYRADSLCPGTYSYDVTDSGATYSDTGTVTITSPPPLSVAITNVTPACFGVSNGTASLIVNGGTTPYTYAWGNGITGNFPTINGLAPGVYSVTVTDSNGCSLTLLVIINSLPPPTITFTYTLPTCSACADGSIAANVFGGSAPYTYIWMGLGGTTSTLANIPEGIYQLCVTDASGCFTCTDAYLADSTHKRIIGKVYYDVNNNGAYDISEPLLSNERLQLLPDSSIGITNNGNYTFFTAPGNYIDTMLTRLGWHATTQPAHAIALSSTDTSGLDFGIYPDNPTPPHVILSTITPLPRCLSTRGYTLFLSNYGTNTANGYVSLTTNAFFISSTPMPDSVVNNTYYWNYNNLNFGQSQSIFVMQTLPSAGMSVQMHSTIVALDINGAEIDSSSSDVFQVTSCSYDPNEKRVSPAGISPLNAVLMNTPFDFTIDFQNTGNDTAYTIVIADTLSNALEPMSLEITGSSHPVTLAMDNNGIVTFRFDNIMLPDSSVNEPTSHGFVSYRIRPRPNLPDPTTINNTAYIYFDQNAAVVTNTTLNTLSNTEVGIHSISQNNSLSVYPNPFNMSARIKINQPSKAGYSFTLFNAVGASVREYETIHADNFIIQKQNLPTGIYLLRSTDIATGETSTIRLAVE